MVNNYLSWENMSSIINSVDFQGNKLNLREQQLSHIIWYMSPPTFFHRQYITVYIICVYPFGYSDYLLIFNLYLTESEY